MSDVITYTDLDYRRAFTETLEVLKNIPSSELKKIPNDVLQIFVANADTSYDFEIDGNWEFKDIHLSDLTLALLENLYRDYWVTDIEREIITKEENNKRMEIEEAKKEKYNIDNMFKKKETIKETKAMVEVKEEKWFEKIFKAIRNLLNKLKHGGGK